MLPGLGIDFGGVICERVDGDEERLARLRPESVLPVFDAFDVIAEMNRLLRGRVWVVSKLTRETEEMARKWLKHYTFAEMTGVTHQRVRFVRDRSGKLDTCLEFGITHFVDDRVKTLEALRGAVEHLYLFGGESVAEGIAGVRDWAELRRLLHESIGGQP